MKIFLSIVLLVIIQFGCIDNKQKAQDTPQLTQEEKYDSILTLAIEKNLKYRNFNKICVASFTGATSASTSVFTLPINKEIIDAAADLKCWREKIPDSSKRQLKQISYYNFFRPNRISCILMAVVGDYGTSRFKDFKNNVSLKIENGIKLPLADFTPTLEKTLTTGFNAGYIYFNGTLPDSVNSFAIDFSTLTLDCGPGLDSEDISFAYSFDLSQINFLSLLENGMSTEKIREKYGLRPYKEAGISSEDFTRVVNFIITILKAAKEISVLIS